MGPLKIPGWIMLFAAIASLVIPLAAIAQAPDPQEAPHVAQPASPQPIDHP